jgi:hypothetical protein
MRAKRLLCSTLLVTLVCGYASAAATSTLGNLPDLKNFKAQRQSSADPSGGNSDGRQDKPIQPGETREMAKIDGAGAITHIWVTIASGDKEHLRNLVLRMYWDGETNPSVEAPIGDFFGQGNGKYYQYTSLPLQMGTTNGMNSFWRMPFGKGARVTVTNEGPRKVDAFYYYVDYQQYRSLSRKIGRFHAQYHQTYPCVPGENYVILDAKGKGHYVGTNLSIHLRADGWWGEGDDMIYVDGEPKPSLQGTGSEDYFCGAWCYGAAFSDMYLGCPQRGEHKTNAFWNVYRYHIEDPIPFTKSIRVTIEHGHANDRSDDFSSVAYWYQAEPHAPFPALPPANDRIPKAAPLPEDYREEGAMELDDQAGNWKGGPVSMQDMATMGKYSGGAQLFFQPTGPATYTHVVPLAEANAKTYKLEQWYTAAPDYGTCELWLNGQKVAEWDGYNKEGVVRKKNEFTVTTKTGNNTVELRITGKNAASEGYYAGIDCWRLTPQ